MLSPHSIRLANKAAECALGKLALDHFFAHVWSAILQAYVESVLLPHGLIVDRVEKLAQDIRNDYPASTPHLLVVLKGGSEFASDLSRTLRRLHTYKETSHLPFTMDYVRVKSYEGTESTGTGEFRLWILHCMLCITPLLSSLSTRESMRVSEPTLTTFTLLQSRSAALT